MLNRKTTIIAIGILVMCIMLFSVMVEAKTKVVVTHWFPEWHAESVRRLMDEFEKDHPDIEVVTQRIPGEHYYDKLLTMIAGGNPPDVMYFSPHYLADWVEKGALKDLNSFIERDSIDLSNFLPVTLEHWNIGGKQYGFPDGTAVFLLYYNKGLFDKAGVQLPRTDWTWNEFLAAAKKLTQDTNGDGKIDQWGFSAPANLDTLYNWAFLNGASLWNEDMTKSLLDDPLVVEAFQFYQDLIYRYGVTPRPETQDAQGFNEMFESGKIAMTQTGTWMVFWWRKRIGDKFDWRISLLPRGSKDRPAKVISYSSAYVMPVNTKHPKEAWEVIKFTASDRYITEDMVKPGIAMPTTYTQLEDNVYLHADMPPYGVTTDFVRQAMEMGRELRRFDYPLGFKIQTTLNKLEDILLGEGTAKEICQKVAVEINNLLKERPWNK